MKIFSALLFIFIFSCKNGIDVDTSKNTASDPIADITFLNGYFYTTNLDNSGNVGHQIDLFKFDSVSNPINRFELPLNGQGYLAAANDGNNLYFQPRYTDYIFKMTQLGEIFWNQSDHFPDNTSDTTSTFMYWRGRGLAWADTNLVVLYRHKDERTHYRSRYLYIKNDTLSTIIDTIVTWRHLNSYGAYAMEYNAETKGFWILAIDSLNQYIRFTVDSNFVYSDEFEIIDGIPMGISSGPDSRIYLSFKEREILAY